MFRFNRFHFAQIQSSMSGFKKIYCNNLTLCAKKKKHTHAR